MQLKFFFARREFCSENPYVICVNGFPKKHFRGKTRHVLDGVRDALRPCADAISSRVLSMVYGAEECLSCGKIAYDVPVCAECWKKLENYVGFDSGARCSKCGRILISEIGTCLECREHPSLTSLDALYPLHSYSLWKRDLAFAWKMEGQRRLSPLFARLLYDAMCSLGLEKKLVVPVPPRPGKLKIEGWDQIEELSRILSGRHGVRTLALLERKTSLEQKKLGRDERLGAAGAVYAISSFAKERVKFPEEVVLLDDIVTTGATMEKCAWLLREAGVQKVSGIALFKV